MEQLQRDTEGGSPFTSLSALTAVRRSTLGLRPVGDSAILAVRPALLLPWEDVRVGCSKEPFLQAKRKPTTTSGMNPRTSKITKDRQGKHTPQAAHYLELLLLEYNLRKCILFKDSMLRTGGRLQRLSSCQMQGGGKKRKTFALGDSNPKIQIE